MLNQYPYSFNSPTFQQSFPQQQIPTANGRSSVDNIRLAPNSSMLIADSTLPIIYRCVSDSIGNVSISSYDITPHKDEEQIKKEQIELILADLAERIERLENESTVKRTESNNAKYEANQTVDEHDKERKQSSSNGKSVNSKQS